MILLAFTMLVQDVAASKPTEAEARAAVQAASVEYFDCVRMHAERWAATRDDAQAIAEAVIAACPDAEDKVHNAMTAQMIATGVPPAAASRGWKEGLQETVYSTAKRRAIMWVLDARLPAAKR